MEHYRTVAQVWDIAAPLMESEGLEVVEVEFRPEGSRGWVLRVYVDKEGGPNLDDLTHVSRQLSDLLDVHDVPQTTYTLEVSSPGINRPLRKLEHFVRFLGKRVRIRAKEKIEGRKSFVGLLRNVTSQGIVIFHERREVHIPHNLIDKANYEHDWGGKHK